MFDRIAGDIVHRSPTRIVVRTGGIGYEIEIPVSTYEKLPQKGDVEILTHLYMREDCMKLFGFSTPDERALFRLLLSVSGVGPRLALTILSGSTVASFVRAVKSDDVGFLTSVKGIGKKRAQRIALELKDSVSDFAAGEHYEERQPGVSGDAVEALVSLGYKKKEAESAVRAALSRTSDGAGVEDIIRAALSGV